MPHRSLVMAFLLVATVLPAPLMAGDLGTPHSGSLKDGAFDATERSWSGRYLGVHGGYGWGDSSFRDGGTDITNPPYGAFSCGPALTGNYCGTPFELAPESWLGGLQLGANWQKGRIVFGVEGDLGYLDVSEESVLIRPFDDRDFASVEYGWYGTATARLGYAFDRSLFYIKGGLARARIETEAYDLDDSAPYEGSRIRSSDTHAGWALGGGLEHALSDHLSLKPNISTWISDRRPRAALMATSTSTITSFTPPRSA